MSERISRPELWATLKDALERHGVSHQKFDQLMDQYDRGLTGDVETMRDPSAPDRPDVELAVFEAITAEEYTEAQLLVRGMAPKDRAVLEFWAGEVAGLVSNVQMSEDRFTT